MRSRESGGKTATFFNRRNFALAVVVGPFMLFASLAIGVTDQGFESVVGPHGFVLAGLIAAGFGVIFLLIPAAIGNAVYARASRTRTHARAALIARACVAVMLALTYLLAFMLPTPKWQLYAMFVVALLLGMLVSMTPVGKTVNHSPLA